MFQLRPDQFEVKSGIFKIWETQRNALAVMPTGGGKTVVVSDIVRNVSVESCVLAHRQELVSQISLALATNEVPHKIIAANKTVEIITKLHRQKFGKSFYNPNSTTTVASVDTIIKRSGKTHERWCNQIGLWVTDECHHLLKKNKWGTAVDMFPNAYGLGVTATPCRADGNGLGAHADGVFHAMVEGLSMRELIDRGSLADYRVFCPESDIDFSSVSISGSTGDLNKNQLIAATKSSEKIVGDVVGHYKRIAMGLLGITFAVDIEHAEEIARKFNAEGVPAVCLTAKTGIVERSIIMDRFARREIWQLVNCDILGEGVDVPAVQVVSFARKTESYGLFCQQFGRALRRDPGNPHKIALIIDHVGNVHRHSLPDCRRVWTLDRRERNSKSIDDAPPVTDCTNVPACGASYLATKSECPYCKVKPTPAERTTPEQVEGDLIELSPEALQAMRGEIDKIAEDAENIKNRAVYAGAPAVVAHSMAKNQRNRQEAQEVLRDAIATWAGYQKYVNRSDSEIYRWFYHKFGIDMMSAQALGKPDAEALLKKVERSTFQIGLGIID